LAPKRNSKSPRSVASRATSKPRVRTVLPGPLTYDQVYAECKTGQFRFSDTANRRHSHDIIAQDRAVEAINIGLGIQKPGYNIYVAGYQGTGKTSVIRSFLEKWSKDAPDPFDWIYVHDFENKEAPKAIRMTKGEGRKLKKRIDSLIKDLREEVPKALQSEDYENAVNSYISSSNERKGKLFTELERLAKSMDFAVKSTRVGIETVPVIDGRTLTEKDYNKLDEKQREDIESRRNKLEPEVLDFARKVRTIDQESKDYIENIRSEVGNQLVSSLMEPLFERYLDTEEISSYLERVKAHVLENILDFAEDEEEEQEDGGHFMDERDRFRKYAINVFVDNTHAKGAPIVIENNPTYYNLFGKVEKNVEHGMYLTDQTMVKNGAVQRANGGYLVLHVLDIFKNPQIWETLKRVLRSRKAFIEDMGEQYSMLPTSGLRPEPIPLDLKVVLIGSDEIYHLLVEEDEEFHKIFKIKADFDFKMERNAKNVNSYATFVATRSKLEDLLPFDRSGVAAIIEFSSRLVEDQRLLSTQFGDMKDLTIEADYVARQSKSKSVRREHVESALDQKFYRLNLVEEHMLQMTKNEDVLLSVDGQRIGQINGLTVLDMGDIQFGRIARITCTTSMNDDGIINIERASRLSGKLHDKGMFILSGFIKGILARERGLGISASVCFEQSYGYIDGDSASCAEMIAIFSSIAGIPIRQEFAITGSVNQLGDVQTIGGVNEKIEGFFKTCRLIGRQKKGYGVVIPKQNAVNLMLHRDAREAVRNGYLEIYPVSHIWEAFALMTNHELGIRDYYDEKFIAGSALEKIRLRIDHLLELKRSFHRKGLEVMPATKESGSGDKRRPTRESARPK
jgi:lon-related putative ATP-dependent protease